MILMLRGIIRRDGSHTPEGRYFRIPPNFMPSLSGVYGHSARNLLISPILAAGSTAFLAEQKVSAGVEN